MVFSSHVKFIFEVFGLTALRLFINLFVLLIVLVLWHGSRVPAAQLGTSGTYSATELVCNYVAAAK
jgi:hypothetical protein